MEASILLVALATQYSDIIPPKVSSYINVGHCSPECTSRKLPADGINIFTVFPHSHLLGRKMKLRHFRGQVELPWILTDNNYDFNFQQARPLREPVNVLPGDQLTIGSINTNKNLVFKIIRRLYRYSNR